jgi:hypothetical protein
MDHPSRNKKDIGAEGDLNCAALDLEVSKERNFSTLPEDCSSGVLVKNVADFCPCLKSLPEAKVKRFIWLIVLTKEVSNQPSLDSVLWLTLLKSVLIKHSKLRKKKCKMYGSRGGGGGRFSVAKCLFCKHEDQSPRTHRKAGHGNMCP